MKKSLVSELLRTARVAELRDEVLEVAALTRLTPVELPRRGRARSRIIRLLANERRRSAKLISELTRG